MKFTIGLFLFCILLTIVEIFYKSHQGIVNMLIYDVVLIVLLVVQRVIDKKKKGDK
jgi:c-di-AMP phosphodiesterase-like protein